MITKTTTSKFNNMRIFAVVLDEPWRRRRRRNILVVVVDDDDDEVANRPRSLLQLLQLLQLLSRRQRIIVVWSPIVILSVGICTMLVFFLSSKIYQNNHVVFRSLIARRIGSRYSNDSNTMEEEVCTVRYCSILGVMMRFHHASSWHVDWRLKVNTQ